MTLNKETFEKFGYTIDQIPPKSNKPIVVSCDECHTILARRKADVYRNTYYHCRACSLHLSSGAMNRDSQGNKEKRKATFISKYGVSNAAQIPGSSSKSKQTSLIKYGVEHISQLPEFKEAKKEVTLAKHGVDHFFKTVEFKEKMEKTNQDRYGCVNPALDSSILAKTRATNISRYGTANPFASSLIKERIKETCLKRYGVDNAMKNPVIRAKAQATLIARYGRASLLNFYGKTEKEIQKWLLDQGLKFTSNYDILDGKEIDLYNSDLKLGIEYCGLYWHCEQKKSNRSYHYDKMTKCRQAGVRLITIFEDEWVHREEQVKNFILSVLGKNRKVFARKCRIVDLDKNKAKEFYNNHHIQGANNLGFAFAGLTFQGELLAVMSFGRHHRTTTQTTLDRFCSKSGWSVAGGASRLFKHLLQKTVTEKVISWSDNRWSEGAVYLALGFSKEKELPPDYSYVDTQAITRSSKQSQKKSNVKCPDGKTEKEWAAERGKFRIWDCGKIRWVYHNT